MLALAAGADALCLGHDLHEEAVEQVHAAIVDAVRSGRLAEERLADAAARVAAVCRWASPTDAGAADREVGAEAARRALEVSGDVAVGGPILVLELVPEANIAAGEALARARGRAARRRGGATREGPADLAALLAQHEGRRLVARRPRRRSACVAGGDGGGSRGRCAPGCDRRRDRASPAATDRVDRHPRRGPRKPGRGGRGASRAGVEPRPSASYRGGMRLLALFVLALVVLRPRRRRRPAPRS